jgi:hypothetical protein
MAVQAFGYLGIGAADLDAWSEFAIRQLGLQQVDGGGSSRAFRMDDRRQRIIADRDAAAERFFGWEAADGVALDALGGRLEAAGVAVRQEPRALADQRFVSGLISFRDPDGNRLEAFHGPMLGDQPFKPGWNISGFRTGTQGLGHAVLMSLTSTRPWRSTRGCWGSGSAILSAVRSRPRSCTSTRATTAWRCSSIRSGPACTT